MGTVLIDLHSLEKILSYKNFGLFFGKFWANLVSCDYKSSWVRRASSDVLKSNVPQYRLTFWAVSSHMRHLPYFWLKNFEVGLQPSLNLRLLTFVAETNCNKAGMKIKIGLVIFNKIPSQDFVELAVTRRYQAVQAARQPDLKLKSFIIDLQNLSNQRPSHYSNWTHTYVKFMYLIWKF